MSSAVLLQLISPLVAVVIAVWGFRRSTGADRLRAFFELQERYLAKEVRDGRRTLHQVVAGKSADEVAKLDRNDLNSIGYTLAVMNSIAIACAGRYVDVKLVSRSMGRSYNRAVIAAAPYIDHLETVRGYRPYLFAERLAAKLQQGGRDAVEPS
jgi:hypothetical protein